MSYVAHNMELCFYRLLENHLDIPKATYRDTDLYIGSWLSYHD